MSKYVPGIGPINPKLLILGDSPSSSDVAQGKPFTGSAGRELDSILKVSGIKRDNCWLTNVCKYEVPIYRDEKVPFSIRASRADINLIKSIEELQVEINQVKPNCILALGSTALWALYGKNKISQFRGSILYSGMGCKFISTYNPRDLTFQSGSEIKGYWNRQIIIFDFKRARAQSEFSEYIIPNRTLEICKGSFHLLEFIQRYSNHKRMSVDIEAMGSGLPACIGIAFNERHGMTVPLWNCDGISHIPDSDLVQCWLLLSEILNTKSVIGQNFNYDRDKLLRLGFKVSNYVSDTMLKAFTINPELPKGLAFNTSIYTEEAYYKDEGMYEGTTDDLLRGCARDACVTYEINESMNADLDEIGQREYYENFIMKLPDLYWSIELQGFKIDILARDRLLYKYIEWDERLRYDLFNLVGDYVNVNSPKQISILLHDVLKLPYKKSTGEEAITELLNSPSLKDENTKLILEKILENRRVRKAIGTYLMALPDFDGRMRTTYFPCLETGRSSTGKQEPPIRPKIEVIDENNKKVKKDLGIAFQTMTKHGDIGADIREMYIPDSDDEVFIQADSSQAEARVVWLLADDEEALRLVDEIDYHALTATWFFGTNSELHNYSKKDLGYEHPIRFAGKTLRHAGHLGAGKRRASIEVNTQARKYKIPIHISEAIAGKALEIFHKKQPKIQKIFQQSVIDCLHRNRILIAPIPYGIEAKYGGRRTFYERDGEELYRQGFSYIPQRTVSDNTKAAGFRIRTRIPNIKIVMEAHDALLFCVKKEGINETCKIIKEEFERPINFSNCSIPRRDLVIPCEIEIGNNYYDMSKFKFHELELIP